MMNINTSDVKNSGKELIGSSSGNGTNIGTNNNNNNNNNSNKFKRWNGTTTTIQSSPSLSSSSSLNSLDGGQDLKRELELRSLELARKNEEIVLLNEKIMSLSEQYSQELAICVHYSNNLSNLQKEVYQMKNQFLLKEEQYKKQIQDLQYKLYCDYHHQPVGKLRI